MFVFRLFSLIILILNTDKIYCTRPQIGFQLQSVGKMPTGGCRRPSSSPLHQSQTWARPTTSETNLCGKTTRPTRTKHVRVFIPRRGKYDASCCFSIGYCSIYLYVSFFAKGKEWINVKLCIQNITYCLQGFDEHICFILNAREVATVTFSIRI